MLVFYPTACNVVNYSNIPSALIVTKDAAGTRRLRNRSKSRSVQIHNRLHLATQWMTTDSSTSGFCHAPLHPITLPSSGPRVDPPSNSLLTGKKIGNFQERKQHVQACALTEAVISRRIVVILDQTQVRLLGLWLRRSGRWHITFHQALLNQNIHNRRPNNSAHFDTRQVPRNELERRSKPTPQIALLLAGLTTVFRDRPLVLDFDLRVAAFAPDGPGAAPSAKCCWHLPSI
jgi:hypothetical protein